MCIGKEAVGVWGSGAMRCGVWLVFEVSRVEWCACRKGRGWCAGEWMRFGVWGPESTDVDSVGVESTCAFVC